MALSLKIDPHFLVSPKASFLRQKPHLKHSWTEVRHEWGQGAHGVRGLSAVVLPLPDTGPPHLPTGFPAAAGQLPFAWCSVLMISNVFSTLLGRPSVRPFLI